MMSLLNKTILITGASSGIGRAVAEACASNGGMVIVSARNKLELEKTAAGCHNNASIFVADLTIENDIVELSKALPLIDGWVHCTGKVLPVPVKFIQEKHLSDVFAVNYSSAVKLGSALLQQKKLKEHSSLVFISSVSVLHSYFGGAPYVSSKAALEAYAKTLALELAPKKIRVNVLQPGLVKTAIYQSTVEAAMKPGELEQHEKKYPLGIGLPEDVANACVFFLSDASKWITGSSLKMDGGLTLGFSS
jgi:NAD(P)-dependent dehydrogenase (short-subunit alcohol dehydrogenase family)